MSEPGFQPVSLEQTRQDGLWDKAPAWRNLTVAASLLTLAAVAAPLLSSPPAETVHLDRVASAKIATAAPNLLAPPRTPALPVATSQASATLSAAIPKPATSATHHVPPPVRTALLPAHPETMPQSIPESATLPNPATACGITIGTQVLPMGGGVVIGYEETLAAQRRLSANERTIGGPINPTFANTPRAIVQPEGNAPGAERQIVVVPPGMTVGVGDHVTFNRIHRDAAMPCGYVPPLITSDTGPSASKPTSTDTGPGARPSELASLPPPTTSTSALAGGGSSQPAPNPSTMTATAAPDLPLGTIIASPGVVARVNRHNRYGQGHDWPITITIISPPAHGTVTTQDGTGPITYPNGVTRISSVTSVLYKSAPGYTGMDTFTYKRTSSDPSDPRNANTYTITIDVK
jgi:hypothetical protein